MQKAKVDVLIVLFAYSGNGGVASTIPQLVWWVARNYHKMKSDERIGRIAFLQICDTPITMTRNRAVREAQNGGFDMLLMLDSDNEPDGYLDVDPEAKPFWDTAFTHAYDRLIQGKPTVAFAPYCGPPPHPIKGGAELPYLFFWTDDESDSEHPQRKIEMLTRNEAAMLRGIHPMAGGPTGVSLWTVNAFEGLPKPYFQYGFTEDGAEKHTTEDCFATRNVSLFWQMKTGENPVVALCDSWALHHKTKVVGRPRITPVESIAEDFREALRNDLHIGDSIRNIDYSTPPPGEVLPQKVNGHKSNGHAILGRVIGRHSLQTLGEPMTDADVAAIGDVVEMASQGAGGRPLRMACLWPFDGQSAAAMLSSAPEGSIVYCLTDGSDKQADELLLKNTAHLEDACRIVPFPPLDYAAEASREALDIVYIGDANRTADAVAAWLPNLAQDGCFVGSSQDRVSLPSDATIRRVEGSGVWFVSAESYQEAESANAS